MRHGLFVTHCKSYINSLPRVKAETRYNQYRYSQIVTVFGLVSLSWREVV